MGSLVLDLLAAVVLAMHLLAGSKAGIHIVETAASGIHTDNRARPLPARKFSEGSARAPSPMELNRP